MQIVYICAVQNLGATCYANAFLQVCILYDVLVIPTYGGLEVWFRDLAFRHGVYQCQPSQDTENSFEVCFRLCDLNPEPDYRTSLQDSPVFQLQVTFAALQESTQNVYNPAKFAESLKLSTSEQQDAQELVLLQEPNVPAK